MVKLIILSSLFFIVSYNGHVDSSLVDDWKLVKEEKGVKLYNRPIKGFEYKEVKAILNLNTDLEKARNYLLDPANIEKWMSGCTMSISRKANGNTREYYTIFDAPWPLSDRDDYGIMELKELSNNKLRIDFKSLPKGTPSVTSMVRVPYSRGHVVIETTPKGNKVLVYQMLVDRGGALPSYLTDYLENTSPVKTVHNLKAVLESL